MAIDTFFAFVGVYSDVDDAEADYQLVKDLHLEVGLIDAYDAAVVERRDDGKVKIVKKHEQPTRKGGWRGAGIGLATGAAIALFPAAAIGSGLLATTTAGGAAIGAFAGHVAKGLSRGDLKELGEFWFGGGARFFSTMRTFLSPAVAVSRAAWYSLPAQTCTVTSPSGRPFTSKLPSESGRSPPYQRPFCCTFTQI